MPFFVSSMVAIAIACGILIVTEPPDEAALLDRASISSVSDIHPGPGSPVGRQASKNPDVVGP